MSPAIELASVLERNQRPGRLSMEPIMETRQEQSTRGPVRNRAPITICRVPPPLEPLPKTGRRKLWNISHKYHCPVIGTCLGVDELRRVASRLVLRGDAPTTDYDIHVTFVGAADTKNAISLATHKALERKYQSVVTRFARARGPETLYILWSEFLARGEAQGAFWALMTHPKADPSLLNQAYEEVHMLSHQVGAGQRADLKRLAETQGELQALKRDFDALYIRTRRQAEEREERIREARADAGGARCRADK